MEEKVNLLKEREESEDEFNTLKGLLTRHIEGDIVDFDEHLEEPSLDWKNDFIKI